MPQWTCPACGRRFGKRNQSHECAPGLSLDDYFSTGPERERPIFEAVNRHLDPLGDSEDDRVHVEPVSVGIFFKVSSTFAQLRPMTKWVALTFFLDRNLATDPDDGQAAARRLSRKVAEHNGRYLHAINLVGPDEVDDDVGRWLTESYFDDVARL